MRRRSGGDLEVEIPDQILNGGKRRSCYRYGFLKIILILICTALILEILHIWLNIHAIQSLIDHIDEKEDLKHGVLTKHKHERTTLPPVTSSLLLKRTDGHIRLIIYSYKGIESLPMGTLLADLFAAHPDVHLFRTPFSIDRHDGVGFPSLHAKQTQTKISRLLNCEESALIKYYTRTNRHIKRRHLGDCSRDRECFLEQVTSCFHSQMTALDIYMDESLELKDIVLDSNETLYVIHLVADPRLVATNLWLRQTQLGEEAEFSVDRDLPVVKHIAESYCGQLNRDINAVKRELQTRHEHPFKYLSIRYEDLLTNTESQVFEILNFADLTLTEKVKEKIESTGNVQLVDLYKDLRLQVKEIANKECTRQMETLAYETNRNGKYLEQLEPWWIGL